MKRNLIKMACALSVGFSPSFVLAQTESATKGVESTGPSVKDGADKTASSNSSGQVMSYLMGGTLITTGVRDISTGVSSENYGLVMRGVMEVSMGILSMKQGNAHGSTANMAMGTGFQTDGFGMDPYATANLDPRVSGEVKAAYASLGDLEKKGILDLKKGTIKAGDKTFKLSDFGSAGSMAAAGLPKGAIDGAMDFANAVGKKAADKMEKMKLGSLTAANGYEEGGGRGSGLGASASEEDSSAMTGLGVGAAKFGLDRDPSSLAGMQKNYNGEPIGVAADSIFLMMTRRYKVKESQESFYTDAELALQK